MTLQDLERAYLGQSVSMKKIADRFRYLGKFGQSVFYQFSFDQNSYHISTDVCIDDGRITGLIPEKEAVCNEWGECPEETEELTEEELSSMQRYLDSILLTEAELAMEAAAKAPTVMGMDYELYAEDEDDEDGE